ncbi:hypothetical protein TNCV_3165451 [Trichonephila clavipes]|nr:hypothetical protein TNCV_3165451 [Trichonephila clavipes]
MYSNHWARSTTFSGRCSCFPIISQTYSIEDRSGDLAGQGELFMVVITLDCVLSESSVNDHGEQSRGVTLFMVDNDESGAVIVDMTINLSSRSSVALGQPLPSRR